MIKTRAHRIEEKALRLLEDSGQVKSGELQWPVDVEAVAKYLGLTVWRRPLEEEYAGLIEMNEKVIVVNDNLSRVKQRWYIAHAIGHYQLHRRKFRVVIDRVRGGKYEPPGCEYAPR